MFTLQWPKFMVRQQRSSWNVNSTYLKTIKASENWDFYVVLNCKEVGQGLWWTVEQTLSKEHQSTLKSLKTICQSICQVWGKTRP